MILFHCVIRLHVYQLVCYSVQVVLKYPGSVAVFRLCVSVLQCPFYVLLDSLMLDDMSVIHYWRHLLEITEIVTGFTITFQGHA